MATKNMQIESVHNWTKLPTGEYLILVTDDHPKTAMKIIAWVEE